MLSGDSSCFLTVDFFYFHYSPCALAYQIVSDSDAFYVDIKEERKKNKWKMGKKTELNK